MIPQDFRDYVKSREVRFSLGTECRATAIMAAIPIVSALPNVTERLRQMADKNIEISPQYLKALAEETRHTIREEAAKLINDDLAHAAHLRSIIVSASEHLQATSLKEAVLVMRAAAAYSTAIKNSSDTLRHTLRIDRMIEDSAIELPELVIRELTPEEIAKLRQHQRPETEVVLP